jgi:hypothetical protein
MLRVASPHESIQCGTQIRALPVEPTQPPLLIRPSRIGLSAPYPTPSAVALGWVPTDLPTDVVAVVSMVA